ncbi:MAG: peptidase T [Clostridia bacterium]|nr:peptidase T [Clostridia bacterium]
MSVKEKFLKYVKIDTTSDENSLSYPSTPSQTELLKILKGELESLGVKAEMDEYCYVTAIVEGKNKKAPKIAFLAHVDTSSAVSGKVNPISRIYKGGDIELGSGIKIAVKDNPDLLEYIGEDIITSDGSSLLGADDKAGVAEIMEAVEYLVNHPDDNRGDVYIAFTPDEEIGRGPDYFDVKKFGADFGYTLDGGKTGEIEYENFNAASGKITIKGKSIHPGNEKNKMVNAVDVFNEFHNLLPLNERPCFTEKYEGFYMIDYVSGGIDELSAKYIIRDHDKEKFEKRKAYFASAAEFINRKYGYEVIKAEVKDSYYNMAEIIKKHFHLVESAKEAFLSIGVEPRVIPIRGGTDGAMLSHKGLPCPNLSTGGFNFHGQMEYIPVSEMEKMVKVVLKLVDIYSQKNF